MVRDVASLSFCPNNYTWMWRKEVLLPDDKLFNAVPLALVSFELHVSKAIHFVSVCFVNTKLRETKQKNVAHSEDGTGFFNFFKELALTWKLAFNTGLAETAWEALIQKKEGKRIK